MSCRKTIHRIKPIESEIPRDEIEKIFHSQHSLYEPYMWKKYLTNDYEYNVAVFSRPKMNWVARLLCGFCN